MPDSACLQNPPRRFRLSSPTYLTPCSQSLAEILASCLVQGDVLRVCRRVVPQNFFVNCFSSLLRPLGMSTKLDQGPVSSNFFPLRGPSCISPSTMFFFQPHQINPSSRTRSPLMFLHFPALLRWLRSPVSVYPTFSRPVPPPNYTNATNPGLP